MIGIIREAGIDIDREVQGGGEADTEVVRGVQGGGEAGTEGAREAHIDVVQGAGTNGVPQAMIDVDREAVTDVGRGLRRRIGDIGEADHSVEGMFRGGGSIPVIGI